LADAASDYLVKTLKNEIKDFSGKITINSISSLLTIFFKGGGVNNFRDVMKSDANMFKKFFKTVLNDGLFIAPSQYEAMFLSSRHTKADLDKTVFVIKKAVKEVI
jgi:glutamate-1-semialdehyde 2,1-aminomutase